MVKRIGQMRSEVGVGEREREVNGKRKKLLKGKNEYRRQTTN